MSFASLERANYAVLALTLVGWLAAKFFFIQATSPLAGSEASFGFVPSLLLGGLIMSLNFSLLGRLMRFLLQRQAKLPLKVIALLIIGSKSVLLGLAVFGLFHYLALRPWGFMVGVSLMLLTPLGVSLYRGVRL